MLNNIDIQGRLGQDPELKEYDGKNGPYKRVSFSLANNRPYGDETDWIDCYMSGKRAEVIDKYCSKGTMLIVSGRLQTYKDRNGAKKSYIEVKDFHFVPNGRQNSEPAPEGFTEVYDDEDAPF